MACRTKSVGRGKPSFLVTLANSFFCSDSNRNDIDASFLATIAKNTRALTCAYVNNVIQCLQCNTHPINWLLTISRRFSQRSPTKSFYGCDAGSNAHAKCAWSLSSPTRSGAGTNEKEKKRVLV